MSDLRPVIFSGLFSLIGVSLIFYFGFIDFEGAALCFAAVVLSVIAGMYLQVLERRNRKGELNG